MKRAIIIIGGFNSVWPAYLAMARDLEDISGLRTIGVPLMLWHWWQAGRSEDATNLLQKLEETVVWARRKYQAERFILVGHSAGGVLARLYLCEEPVWGQAYAGVEHVTAIITLGSPHCGDRGADTGWFLTAEANRLVPDTPYADRVQYRTIAGRYLQGRKEGSYRERRAFRAYLFMGAAGAVWGDGMVPLCCTGLAGVEPLVLDGVAHSAKIGRNWYGGSKQIIRRWWDDRGSHGD